jgi:hypothetical protein
MLFKTLFRPLALAGALTVALSACSSGTKPGDTNVETGHDKERPLTHEVGGTAGGDSVTAGLHADTTNRPTGKDLLKEAGKAVDRNKDGIAD